MRIFSTLIILIASLSASAEQVYQTLMPAAGQSDFRGTLHLAAGRYEGKAAGNDFDGTMGALGAEFSYSYGVFENHALTLSTTYTSTRNETEVLNTTSKYKTKGLDGLDLGFSGLAKIETASVFYKLDYSLSLEKNKSDIDKDEGNTSSGRNILGVTFGAYTPVSADFTFGGYLNYSKAFDGKSTETSGGVDTDSDLSEGDSFKIAVFMEINNDYHPNIELSHTANYSVEETTAGVSSRNESPSLLAATGSARMELEKDLSLIGSITNAVMTKKVASIEKYNLVSLSATLRYLF